MASSGSCKRALETDSQIEHKRNCITAFPATVEEGVNFNAEKVIIDLDGDNDEEEKDFTTMPSPPEDVEDHIACSSINTDQKRHKFIRNFGVKRFLVHHDYILFPYCTTSDKGKREKPSATLVSRIIENEADERYQEVVEKLQIFDKILNRDTSSRTDVKSLANVFLTGEESFRSKLKDKMCIDFMKDISDLFQKFPTKTDQDNSYRWVFASFLRIVSSTIFTSSIKEEAELLENTVLFPNWNKSTTVSGKPDILIKTNDGRRSSTVAVVKCKRYREMTVLFENTEIKDVNDIEKTIPRVRFCKVVKTSEKADELPRRESILERMYQDLDAAICRPLKQEEKTYFGCFFAQLVGEVVAWFETFTDIPFLAPRQAALEKSVKYAIGQLGFKIIFITVGINSYPEILPHIRIGENEGMGLDVFMTRPFDLMRADDRAKIRDILYAMMSMPWVVPSKVKK